MADQFCFSCGAPTVALGRQVVPVCANCKARGVGERLAQPEWMLKKRDRQKAIGPMSRIAVLSGLARQSFGPDDHISAIGGESLPIADHPDFRGCFIPGSADEVEIQRIRDTAQQSARRAALARMARTVFALGFVGLAAGLLWLSTQSRLLVLPEKWLQEIEASVGWWKTQSNPPPRYLEVVTVGDMPHSNWVSAQKDDSDGLAFLRARSQHWTATVSDLEAVRRLYLMAMSSHPLDPMPLTGLIQVDSEMLPTRPELLGEIHRAVSRMDLLGADGPAVQVARGMLAIAQGNSEKAQRITKSCVGLDPMCDLVFGEATQNTALIQGVLDRYGESNLSFRALCRTGLSSGDWTAVRRGVEGLRRGGDLGPSSSEFEADMYASLGEWDSAEKAALVAVGKGTERADILHLLAAVQFARNPGDFRLNELFDDLLEHPHLGGHVHREAVLIQAAQVQIAVGDLDRAKMIVDASLEANPSSHAARVLLADIFYKSGRHGEAEGVLRDIDTGGLAATDAAMVHRWSARLYFDMDKQRLGRTELESALRLEPRDPFSYLELAYAALETRNTQGAIDHLGKAVQVYPFQGRYRDPREGMGLRMPRWRNVQRALLDGVRSDVRYEDEREPLAAILSWIYQERGHFDALIEALEVQPDHMSLQTAVALAAFDIGEWEIAQKNALTAVTRRPSFDLMHSVRGRALAQLGRFAEAIDPLNRSVKGASEQTDLLIWAARTFAEHGDEATSAQLLAKAKKLTPWDIRIRQAEFAQRAQGQ